jgi:hypothetical protein
MKTVTINFIIHSRYRYFKYVAREFVKLSDNTKGKFNINLFISDYDENFKNTIASLKKNGLDITTFYATGGDNYMSKIRTAVDNSNTYAISIDEDVFIPYRVWDYFINNINILDDNSNVLLSPVITSGIPSADLFIKSFLTEDEQKIINRICTSTSIPNIWGADYSSLLPLTTSRGEWDANSFYKAVDLINHHYRGVHPIRFSYEAQSFLNNICINNIQKICDMENFSITSIERPYFCNSVYGIKTETWKKIINDTSLFKDEFDEVPLNLYMRNNKLKLAFINSGIAIHPSYNTINIYGHDYSRLSDEFFDCSFFK